MRHFIEGAPITRLCLISSDEGDIHLNVLIAFLSDFLPHLETLGFQFWDFQQKDIEWSLTSEHFPRLRTLHLIGCELDLDVLQQNLVSSTVRLIHTDSAEDASLLSGISPSVKQSHYLMTLAVW
jgi:hypothetical protein